MSAERNETEAVIEHELRVAASPDSVFDYFIDPAKMGQWMGEATLDPRPGGVCRVSPCGHAAMLGEYVEIERAAQSRLHVGLGGGAVRDATPIHARGGVADARRRGHDRAARAPAPEARGGRRPPCGLGPLPGEARACGLG